MTQLTVKRAAVKTAKVSGATISLVWSMLVLATAVATVEVKRRNLVKAITA